MGVGTRTHTQTRRVGTLRRISDRFSVLLGAQVVQYVPKWPDCNRREKGTEEDRQRDETGGICSHF
jgi:hypothetical protein